MRIPRVRPHNTRRVAVAALIAVAVGCGRASANESDDSAEAHVDGDRIVLAVNSPKMRSLAAAPATVDSAVATAFNGRLVWDEDATVRVFSPFGGRVVRVAADIGSRVIAGQPLASIAAPDFGQAQADERRAAADLSLAQRSLARQQDLVAHGLVAQKDVEQALADAARARAEQERAVARLALYGGDTTNIDQVFPLKAPIGGEVVERNVSAGQEVRPDQMLANAPQLFAPLFVLTDPSRLWVLLDVPEQDLAFVRDGAPIAIRAQALPDRAFHGRVTVVAGALDPSTRTLKVRGEIDNHERLLKAEMLVTAQIDRPAARHVAVPTSAVLFVGDQHVVFVEEAPGRYVRRTVHIGREHLGIVPVLDGVQAGEHVVTTSALLLEQLFQTSARS